VSSLRLAMELNSN
jgi:asparagine synthetase B (glutamine-hydrolysing)